MPLKNSLGVERRVDLASLFCMIGRHGPAVALAVIAMVSVLAGFVIYRNVRGKRRKAEADASEDRSRGESRDEAVAQQERRAAAMTDESDDDLSDVARKAHLLQSDFALRKRHAEKNPTSYSAPEGEFVKGFVRAEDVQTESRFCGDQNETQEEEGVKEGTDIPDDKVNMQEEDKQEAVPEKHLCLDQTNDLNQKMITPQLLPDELILSPKVDDCFQDENKSQDSSGFEEYNGSADEELKSSLSELEEKSIADSPASDIEIKITLVEPDESQSTSLEDQWDLVAPSEDVEENSVEINELPNECTVKQEACCFDGEQANVGSSVPCVPSPSSGITSAVAGIFQPVEEVQKVDVNAEAEGGSHETEDELVNGLTYVSDEEHDAHVTVPFCDLRPEPAEVTHVVPPGSNMDATESIANEEDKMDETVLQIAESDKPTVAKIQNPPDEESPKMDSLETANIQIEDAQSSSSQKVKEPQSKDCNVMFEEENGVISPSCSEDFELNVDQTSDVVCTGTDPQTDGTGLETSEKNVKVTYDCSVCATSELNDESSHDLVLDKSWDDTQNPSDDPVLDVKPDLNICAEDPNKVDPEQTHSLVVKEVPVCAPDVCQDQQDDDMDWKTSETCSDVAATDTAEEPPNDNSTPQLPTEEDITEVVTAEFSTLTVVNDVPTITVIPDTKVTEIDHTAIQGMDCEADTQTSLYADDLVEYVAKVENKLESYVNEDSFGNEIEDGYHKLVEKLMEQIASTVVSFTDANPVEKKEEESSDKKEASKEKNDEEEVREKTEISIMEATMDHNEWITDGNYQTLPWMNLPISAKTDQRPAMEKLGHSGTDESSMDVETTSDLKLSSHPGVVDDGKKVVAVQPMPQHINVTFQIHYVTHSPYHTLAVTGNQQELGNWTEFVPLEKSKDGHWTIVLSLPAESHVEWKFVLMDKGEVCRWEECGNRLLETGCGEDMLVHKFWGLL